MSDIKKHEVKIELSTLQDTALHAPRKRFWDWLPEWLCMFMVNRGFSPPPTPYETWAIDSVSLRLYYHRFHSLSVALDKELSEWKGQPSGATTASVATNSTDPYRWS